MRRYYDGGLVLTYFEQYNEWSILETDPIFSILSANSIEESMRRLQMRVVLLRLGVI